jgi:hypothetical protein
MHKSALTVLALLSSLPQANTFGVKNLFCFPLAEKRISLEAFDCPKDYSPLEHRNSSFSPSILVGPELSFNFCERFKLQLFSGFGLKGQQYNSVYIEKPDVNSEPLKQAINSISATSSSSPNALDVMDFFHNHLHVFSGATNPLEFSQLLGRGVPLGYDVNSSTFDPLKDSVIASLNAAKQNALNVGDAGLAAVYEGVHDALEGEFAAKDAALLRSLSALISSSASVVGKEKALEELEALIAAIKGYKPKEVVNTISVTQHVPFLASLSCKLVSYNDVSLTASLGSGVSVCKASWKISGGPVKGWKQSDETKFVASPIGMASLGLDIKFGPAALVASVGYIHLGSPKLTWSNGKNFEPSFKGVLVEVGLSAHF